MTWTTISYPSVGTWVKANHPVTTFNPDRYFQVAEIETQLRGGELHISVRGETTCWFGLSGVEPAPPEFTPDFDNWNIACVSNGGFGKRQGRLKDGTYYTYRKMNGDTIEFKTLYATHGDSYLCRTVPMG